MNHYLNKFGIAALALLISFTSCKKSYLDKYPTDEAPLDDVFKTTQSSEAALQGINRMMFEIGSEHQLFGQKSIDLTCDLMGEDMAISDQGSGWFLSEYQYTANRQPSDNGAYVWDFYYRMINNANQIITHIDGAKGLQEERDNIKGQALFYRAFAYYNLSIFYQHTYKFDKTLPCVPIYTDPTRTGNPRASVEEVYNFIKSDLNSAIQLINNSGISRSDKSGIDASVAKGLYARVALMMQDWPVAAQMAEEARAGYTIMSQEDCLGGFNDWGNSEWIWGSRIPEDQASNLIGFVPHMDPAADGYGLAMQKLIVRRVLDSAALMQDASQHDVRVDWFYKANSGIYLARCQKKFRIKSPGTYATDQGYMRSSEMVLIQAEALANMGSTNEAGSVLEELMSKRNPDYEIATDKRLLLRQIWWQRRLELWGEGFRFSDIQRQSLFDYLEEGEKGLHRTISTTRGHYADLVGNAKDITANDNMFLFRMPGSEIQYNPNIPVNNP